MGLLMTTAATTGTAAGYNCLESSWLKESKYPRQVVRIGLAGSAAAGDISFDLYYQNRKVAENLFPTTVGANFPKDDDMLALSGGEICPEGTEMRLVASGAATTNSVYVIIETKERPDLLGRKSTFRGRR